MRSCFQGIEYSLNESPLCRPIDAETAATPDSVIQHAPKKAELDGFADSQWEVHASILTQQLFWFALDVSTDQGKRPEHCDFLSIQSWEVSAQESSGEGGAVT